MNWLIEKRIIVAAWLLPHGDVPLSLNSIHLLTSIK